MIKIHTLSHCCQAYPVGEFISRYYHICEEIADAINEHYLGKSIKLWCRGSSGSMIATLVSQHLENCSISHVKKSGENSHSNSYHGNPRDINIIIDDTMSSGETVLEIYRTMTSFEGVSLNCIVMTGDLRVNSLPRISSDVLLIAGYFYSKDLVEKFNNE
jgi:orotate phosphoribosyltransferase-like protein